MTRSSLPPGLVGALCVVTANAANKHSDDGAKIGTRVTLSALKGTEGATSGSSSKGGGCDSDGQGDDEQVEQGKDGGGAESTGHGAGDDLILHVTTLVRRHVGTGTNTTAMTTGGGVLVGGVAELLGGVEGGGGRHGEYHVLGGPLHYCF